MILIYTRGRVFKCFIYNVGQSNFLHVKAITLLKLYHALLCMQSDKVPGIYICVISLRNVLECVVSEFIIGIIKMLCGRNVTIFM